MASPLRDIAADALKNTSSKENSRVDHLLHGLKHLGQKAGVVYY
jgi:hypothetical protein